MTDSTASVYFDLWAEYADMVRDFTNRDYNDDGIQIEVPADGICSPEDVLFASYTNPGYSGDAVVIFERDGAPLEVSGSHCSCFGLEGQWEPARVTWAALALRLPEMARDDDDDDGYRFGFMHDHCAEAREAFRALVREHVEARP